MAKKIYDPLLKFGLNNDPNSFVEKVYGKGLSTNDYTNAAKAEVAKIASKANLVGGKVPPEELPSYVDDVLNVEHWSSVQPVGALEDDLWYDTVNSKLYVLQGVVWVQITAELGRIYINVDNTSEKYNASYRWSGVTMVYLGDQVTRSFLEGLLVTRTIAVPAYNIDMSAGEDFTKVCGAGSAFTISNPIIKKPFRLFLTGGTLAATLFTGYVSNWILTSLQSDYVPANNNVLWCEIRSAGQIYLFWGA